jgi:hypothetical protein
MTLFDPQPPPDTLADAQEAIRSVLRNPEEHADCPCCGQRVQMYRRKIDSYMAACLVKMYRADPDGGWFDKREVLRGFLSAARTEGLLRHWGLVSEATADELPHHVGMWRVTEAGGLFVRGATRVPKYALLFDSRCFGLDDTEFVHITDALGDKFDLRELLEGDT